MDRFDLPSFLMGKASGSGGGGGGGGSSDYSTATLTIVNTKPNTEVDTADIVCIIDGAMSVFDSSVTDSKELELLLYKGQAFAGVYFETLTSMSGDVTGNAEDGFIVTGDCTLTGEGFGWQ